MGARATSGEHGLWKNIKCIQTFTHWSLSEIADQVHPYVHDRDCKGLHHGLGRVIERHQLRWKYAQALAHAWGIRELELLYGDFTTCTTLDELQRKYGFDLDDIIERWEMRRDQELDNDRSLRLHEWLRTFRKPHDDSE